MLCLAEGLLRVKVHIVPFEIVEAAGIVADAKKNRVTIKPNDIVFVVEGVRAVACIRLIRKRLARLCGCWVAKDARGRGIGEFLVKSRIDYAINNTAAIGMDTFAFNKELFLRLGFAEKSNFKIGTTYLVKKIER